MLSRTIPSCHPLRQNPGVIAWADGPAERLDKLLERANLSNTEVALALGVGDSAVSRWRSGERVPNADVLGEMVRMAGGSADAVLGLPAGPDPRALDEARQGIQKLAGLLDTPGRGER